MHFSVACVARGLTVTEPTTPASSQRVVVARVCDAVEASDRDYLSQMKSGRLFSSLRSVFFWHLNVTPFSRKVKNGGGLSWVDLAYNCSLAGYGRRSTAARCPADGTRVNGTVPLVASSSTC